MTKYNTCGYCNKEYNKNDDGAGHKYCSKECVRNIRNERRRKKNNPHKEVTKECEWCGEQYQVLKRYAYQSKYCSDECGQERYSREVRGYGPAEEDRARRKMQKEQRLARLELERSRKQLRNALNKAIKFKLEVQAEQERIKELTKPCEECGELFYNVIPNTLTCSNECRRKRNNRHTKLYNSTRLNEVNIIDRDITLEKLYKRDDGICYLCGGECDYYDHTITLEGHYIVGPSYPSIDHVIAIANGGMHSWENVKLTHHRCNTLKSDIKLEEYTEALV